MSGGDESISEERKKTKNAFLQFFEEEYDERLKSLIESYEEGRNSSLVIDYRKLVQFDEDLANAVTKNPDTYFKVGEDALREYDDKLSNSHLRLINHGYQDENTVPIREIRSKHIDKMVTLEGIVKTTSMVLPRTTVAYFKCKNCGTYTSIRQPINPKKMKFPFECSNENCNRSGKNSFEREKRKSEHVDFQKIKLEEAPEELRGGQNPESIDVYVRGDITGDIDPGNRVSITGILRADNSKEDNPVLSFFLEGNFIDTEEQEFEEIEISEEEEKEIRETSERDDIYEVVRDSIAPSIYGFESEKMAIGMQLFSGVKKKAPDTDIRGDIHTLLVGDPGTAKSEIIQSAKEIAPRGVYTVGKGSSAAGLTASAVKESDISGDQKWSLEAGALVLADKGLAAVDELDKMRDEDRSALHEALEQQTVSVNKAGINATLKSRCSLLAAANPKYGRFDEYEPVSEQIEIDPALVSRFDLIFTITDEPDEEEDKELAGHILDSNIEASNKKGKGDVYEDILEPEFLRKYIAYARQNYKPTLTEEAKEKIQDFYVELRQEGGDDSPISITAREVQSMVRLSESIARMRLGEKVLVTDVDKAIEVKEKTLEDVGMDPVTGEFDADMLESGTSKRDRDNIRNIEQLIEELSDEYDDEGVPQEEIFKKGTEELGMRKDEIERDLEKLISKGEVMEPRQGRYKFIPH